MKVRYALVYDRKKQVQAKGVGLVQIQAYLQGNRKYITTKLYLPSNEWDIKRQTAKNAYLAKTLREKITALEDFEIQYRALHKHFTLKDFDGLKTSKPIAILPTFTEFFKEQLTKEGHLAFSTLTSQKNTFKTLCDFQPQIKFDELNYELLQNFENYLRTEKNHKINTIEKYHRHLRKYINLAINKDLLAIDKNPYKNYKLVTEETDAIFLTIEERKRIEVLEFNKMEKGLETVRNMFLFSCYTGLRFGDTYALKGSDFRRSKSGLTLKFKALKSHKIGYQPLFLLFDGKPQEIALKYITNNMDAQLFKGFNNGKVNRLLKIIAQRAKVIRGLYFKASRDTFGTTLYLLSGDQKLVQKQLQHSKREQTDKYVHISEQIENEGLKRVFNGNQKG
jgi:integrase